MTGRAVGGALGRAERFLAPKSTRTRGPGGGATVLVNGGGRRAHHPSDRSLAQGGGGGIGRGGSGRARGGGGQSGGLVGGGVQVGQFGVVVVGGGGAQAPLPAPCPPSNHTITITRFEYWDRAGGGRNFLWKISKTNEVPTRKWMRAAQKGLKMSRFHPCGHHNWTRIIFGKP